MTWVDASVAVFKMGDVVTGGPREGDMGMVGEVEWGPLTSLRDANMGVILLMAGKLE